MKRLISALCLFGLVLSGCATPSAGGAAAEHAPGNLPKYGAMATRLVDAQAYVRKQPAPDFWALMPYYLPQRTGSSCSAASVAMVVNASRVSRKLLASDELATEEKMLKRVNDQLWTRGAGAQGGGVVLDQLGELIVKALQAYGVKATTETHHAAEPGARVKLHEQLVSNERSAADFIVANFLQSVFTGDPEGAVGHIAPVGAYDASTKRVLIMDPDRESYEPYWVSEQTFFEGMNTTDSTASRSRGWVFVHLNAQ